MATAELSRAGENSLPAAIAAGDEAAFAALAERYRSELRRHCYRIIGSREESEDMVQETFLRAWRWRRSLRRDSSLRAWLHRIATNVCLDALERRSRGPRGGTWAEQGGPQPPPDRLLEQIAPSASEPDAEVEARETLELTFLATVKHLSARQQAVLILRDVFGMSARETATGLETSVASVNSALQRARAAIRTHLSASRLEWEPESNPSEEERALVELYLQAVERGDADAIAGLLRERPRFSPPPELRCGDALSPEGR